jgi:hypothetical protein
VIIGCGELWGREAEFEARRQQALAAAEAAAEFARKAELDALAAEIATARREAEEREAAEWQAWAEREVASV